jgi:hypothetical protein
VSGSPVVVVAQRVGITRVSNHDHSAYRDR